MKNFAKHLAALAALVLFTPTLNADAPRGYYDECEGLSGKQLLSTLCSVVGGHTNVGYDGLWTVYKTSDVDENGKIWDMYSTKRWDTGASQRCGNYSKVGDCYNREHSMPKSWFNDAQPMYSDAFHLYPTDGKVNGQRSNFPYGECSGGTTLPANGSVKALGRLGKSTFPGYSGTVFEPDDEYKGDFARSYFYMAAAYNDRIRTWNSDMLAGNAFPAFTDWALNLLLKWHRQDPVSKKETDRNEAVSKHQNNRNPFIDHPEMVEHIWGNLASQPWSADASAPASLSQPAPGSTIDLGYAAAGVARTVSIRIKGINFTDDAKLSLSAPGFTLSPKTLTAAQVNQGAYVEVTFKSSTLGAHTANLTITAGALTEKYPMTCTVVSGLPAGPATHVTENSFVARWTSIDAPGTPYTLTVNSPIGTLQGYPLTVACDDEAYEVTSLEASTTYTYTVSSPTLRSEPVSVTTAEPTPDVNFYFDGELIFKANAGEPSDAAELLVVAENLPDDGTIAISVAAPFQLSTDKTDWTTQITLLPDEERFYMRAFSQTAGKFYTTIKAVCGQYTFDDATAQAIITDANADFYEDFEMQGSYGNYSDKTYEGSAATWSTNAYFGTGNSNYPHTGEQAARLSKDAPGYLTMLTDKQGGIGSVSFWARLWGKETNGVIIEVYVSADNGQTWEYVDNIDIPSTISPDGTNEYAQYALAVNRPDATRLSLRQTTKSRTLIDDLRITNTHADNDGTVTAVLDLPYHAWDAYCCNHALVIETFRPVQQPVSVYALDGTLLYNAPLALGQQTLALPAGLYIVVVDDFSRRVLVK